MRILIGVFFSSNSSKNRWRQSLSECYDKGCCISKSMSTRKIFFKITCRRFPTIRFISFFISVGNETSNFILWSKGHKRVLNLWKGGTSYNCPKLQIQKLQNEELYRQIEPWIILRIHFKSSTIFIFVMLMSRTYQLADEDDLVVRKNKKPRSSSFH